MLKVILFILGISYLCIELAFNSSLLDLLSRSFTVSELNRFETYGKLISGAGLWLALMKLVQKRSETISNNRLWLLSFMLIIFSMVLMSNIQNEVADYLAKTSTPNERKAAYAIAYVMPDIISGDAVISGFDLSAADYNSPEGKTYLALLPAYGISSPAAPKVFSAVATQSIDDKVTSKTDENINDAWNQYVSAREHLRSLYNDRYLPASDKFLNNAQVIQTPDDAWNKYLSTMDGETIDIDIYNDQFTRDRVLRGLAKKGMILPNDWAFNDKETFVKAFSASSAPKFSELISKEMGRKMTLPPNLPWEEFVAHKDIQKILKQKINPEMRGHVSVNWTKQELKNKFFKRLKHTEANKIKNILNADASEFADGNAHSLLGQKAVKVVKVPIIALAFSCLFGLINLALLISNLGNIFGRQLWGLAAATTLITGIIVAPLSLDNKISSSEAFHKVIDRESRFIGIALTWITNTEPYVYPASKHILNMFEPKDSNIRLNINASSFSNIASSITNGSLQH